MGYRYEQGVSASYAGERPNRLVVRLIRTALALRLPAHVIVNNRAEGSAPLTIVAVAKLLIEQMRRDG